MVAVVVLGAIASALAIITAVVKVAEWFRVRRGARERKRPLRFVSLADFVTQVRPINGVPTTRLAGAWTVTATGDHTVPVARVTLDLDGAVSEGYPTVVTTQPYTHAQNVPIGKDATCSSVVIQAKSNRQDLWIGFLFVDHATAS